MRRMIQCVTACLLVLAGYLLGVTMTPLAGPERVLALDETITTCDWDTFSASLAAVQADGGGTITFDCTGEIEFANELSISTDVTIIGNGQVIFDGNESTRFFSVNETARLVLNGLTLQNGTHARVGGAIANEGTLEIVASTFSGNNGFDGGAIHNANGSVEIRASTFRDNGSFSISSGGAIENDDGFVEVLASTFTNNISPNGGAFYNVQGTLIITASAFNGNRSEEGGAIYNNDGSTLTITASTFTGNSAGFGGAIENQATTTITASTFSENRGSRDGGAIRNIGPLEVTASTFSGNSALGDGGAIINSRSLEITSSTFSDNGAENGGAISSVNTVNIGASILADSIDSDNCDGTFASEGSNLSDDTSCGFGMDEQGDPNLADLTDNGGPTLTMLPQAPSDALDAADCDDTTSPDQRGAPRPDSGCDIGSVEVGATVPVEIVSFLSPTPRALKEGQQAAIQAVAYGPDNMDLVALLDCDDVVGYETPAPGADPDISGACTFLDDGSYSVGLQVCDGGDPANCDTASLSEPFIVTNLPPVIASITTNAPVPQGQPATITVTATDPGVNDVLTYAFDCDDNGSYETPGDGNVGTCPLDPAQASTTINVLVEDGDGGSDTGSVVVGQQATLCVNYATGTLDAPMAGGCPAGTMPLTLPAPNPTTICVHTYSGALGWSPQGACGPNQRPHSVPADGPLAYCRHTYTGDLRFSWNGQCGPYEQAGVIPG